MKSWRPSRFLVVVAALVIVAGCSDIHEQKDDAIGAPNRAAEVPLSNANPSTTAISPEPLSASSKATGEATPIGAMPGAPGIGRPPDAAGTKRTETDGVSETRTEVPTRSRKKAVSGRLPATVAPVSQIMAQVAVSNSPMMGSGNRSAGEDGSAKEDEAAGNNRSAPGAPALSSAGPAARLPPLNATEAEPVTKTTQSILSATATLTQIEHPRIEPADDHATPTQEIAAAVPPPLDPEFVRVVFARAAAAVGYSYNRGVGRWKADGTDKGKCWKTKDNKGHTVFNHDTEFGADCSGLVTRAWELPAPLAIDADNIHPYATVNFYNDFTYWAPIPRTYLQPGDALVRYDAVTGEGHMFLYVSGDPWKHGMVYEAPECAKPIVFRDRSLGPEYRAIRLTRVPVLQQSP